jgi:predicted DNA-binding protein (MmcQ/YjbR family)
MVTIDQLRALALSFPETTEEPHFEKTSFRVKKKIFVTYDVINHRACIKLSDTDQGIFCCFDKAIIYPVANKWGKQGWTLIEMNTISDEMFTDAVTAAYRTVAPKKLGEQIKSNSDNE